MATEPRRSTSRKGAASGHDPRTRHANRRHRKGLDVAAGLAAQVLAGGHVEHRVVQRAFHLAAIGEALRAGIGIGLLEDNLRLNHEQRAL